MNILLFLFSLNAIAAPPLPSSEVWSVGTTNYIFKTVSKKEPLISKVCENTKRRCDALVAIEGKSKIKFTENDLKGGKNPGSLACQKIFNGEVLILRNSAGAENSFCKFKDHSLASTSELY